MARPVCSRLVSWSVVLPTPVRFARLTGECRGIPPRTGACLTGNVRDCAQTLCGRSWSGEYADQDLGGVRRGVWLTKLRRPDPHRGDVVGEGEIYSPANTFNLATPPAPCRVMSRRPLRNSGMCPLLEAFRRFLGGPRALPSNHAILNARQFRLPCLNRVMAGARRTDGQGTVALAVGWRLTGIRRDLRRSRSRPYWQPPDSRSNCTWSLARWTA